MKEHEDDEAAKAYDEVVQLQLDHFQDSILRATGAELCLIVVDTGKALQASVGSLKGDEVEGRVAATRAATFIAATMFRDAGEDFMELMVRNKETGELYPAMDARYASMVRKR